ncbi:MAG: superoxide dismutase [Verrucomicrobia bacterium]|nr:superoxide dismutase [Verrucomicrobiota bacterium]
MMTRRDALKKTALSAAAVSLVTLPETNFAQAAAPTGPFKLPPLPYALDALEPHIDAKTMEIHHGRHHQAYITNLNKAVATDAKLAGTSLDELIRHLDEVPEAVRAAVRNNGGGHYNHSLFWQTMKKGGGGVPKGALGSAIEKTFGSFEKFKTAFSDAAMKQFGSGWAWLILEEKDLKVVSSPNQDVPFVHGKYPLLGVDVWEHAYYLKYQNKRADYVSAFFNVINWDVVTSRFEKPEL